jgi:hypothetical protein
MRSTKSGHESMQLRVRQSLQRTVPVGQPSHALPTRPQSRYLAHLTASFALGFLAGSLTVLFLLTSRVTVDALVPIARDILLAESPFATPRSMASLCSLFMCLLFLAMSTSFPPGGSTREDASGRLRKEEQGRGTRALV